MTDFLSSDPDEFDNQLHNHFGGIGKERTLLSGTWLAWMNEECKRTKWQCLAAWDDGGGAVCFTMRDPSKAECVHLIYKEKISRVYAVEIFATIKYLFDNPYKCLLKEGYEAPPQFACANLYCELICLGFEGEALIAEYEALGGEYES